MDILNISLTLYFVIELIDCLTRKKTRQGFQNRFVTANQSLMPQWAFFIERR